MRYFNSCIPLLGSRHPFEHSGLTSFRLHCGPIQAAIIWFGVASVLRRTFVLVREHPKIFAHLTGRAPEEPKTPPPTSRRIPSRFGAPAFQAQVCYAPGLTSIFARPAAGSEGRVLAAATGDCAELLHH